MRLATDNPLALSADPERAAETRAAVSATAIRATWRHLPPSPRRGGLSWRAFLRAPARGVLACDLFTIEAIRLQVL